MPGFNNGVVWADNVRFDGTAYPGEVTADGQLLIGSTAAPNIRVGTLTSSDSSVTITPGAGTIDLKAGGSTTYDGDSGSAVPAAGILNIQSATAAGGVADNITTTASGNTVTVSLNNSISQPNTNALGTQGMYSLGGDRFMHDFGGANTFLGTNTGNLSLSGSFLTGIGKNALNGITSGTRNTALGQAALYSATTSSNDTALGFNAMINSASSGGNNVCVGSFSGTTMSSNNNVGVGMYSLQNCSGAGNVAVGYNSMQGNLSGSLNCAVGPLSLCNLTSGNNNVSFGDNNLINLSTGSNNTSIGYSSGNSYTTSESNNILISNSGTVGESGNIHIGTSGIHTACTIAGIASVATSNSQMVTIDTTNGQLGSESFLRMQSSKITLTANQIRNLNGTPITIVPAQGANTIISPVACTAKFIYGGTNQFVGGAGIYLEYTSGEAFSNQVFAASDITGALNVYTLAPMYHFNTSNVPGNMDNVAIVITTDGPEFTGNAANNNSIIIELSYYVSTLT
jgi:hypothetical protein